MTELLIHNEWVPAEGESTHELIDPATRKLLEPIRCASAAQRQRALDAARDALEGWAQRPGEERAALVDTIADEIRHAAGALAERQAIESGQPLRECQDLVAAAIRRLRSGGAADQSPASVPTGAANRGPLAPQVRRLPPYYLWPHWVDVLFAIAAGSTIVCELPADRALTALAIARSAHGLPPGVLNVVTVEPNDEPIRSNEATDFVFIAQDANLDVAVAGATALRLYNTGQRPGQSARIHVEASLAYRFADRLHEYLAFLEAGDPRKPVTDLGPLPSDRAMHRATEHITDALKSGSLVKLGGRTYQPWGLRGYFLQPTLLVEGTGEERVPHESISGPVVIVSPTTDIAAALRAGPPPRRLSAFTAQGEKLERTLRAASFEPRISACTPLVDRAWQPTAGFDLELIETPQLDWFPYKARRGLKL